MACDLPLLLVWHVTPRKDAFKGQQPAADLNSMELQTIRDKIVEIMELYVYNIFSDFCYLLHQLRMPQHKQPKPLLSSTKLNSLL